MGLPFFGSTNNNGAIFTMNTNGTALEVLHAFGGGTDSTPVKWAARFREVTALLYGTASGSQGSSQRGTIFKIDTDGNNYKVLHGFTGVPNDGSEPFGSLVESSEGVLYGTITRTNQGQTVAWGPFIQDWPGWKRLCLSVLLRLTARVQMANDPMPAW